MLGWLEKRIDDLEARQAQMMRVGTVKTVIQATGRARVELTDADGLISYELPVLVAAAVSDKYYHLPAVGDRVLCLFLPFGLEQGFILGAFYDGKIGIPDGAGANLTTVVFRDGGTVKYDRAAHTLTVEVSGDVAVTATTLAVTGNVTVTGTISADGNISSGGDISADGDISSGGDITADGSVTDTTGNTNHHAHS